MATYLELKCAQCGKEGVVEADSTEPIENGGFRFEGDLISSEICEHADEEGAEFYVRVTVFDDEEENGSTS